MGTDAAEKLMRYIDEYYVEPPLFWHKELFEEMSYSRWAAFEILRLIMDNPFEPPDEVVEKFLLKVALYAQVAKEPIQQRIFSIAEDTAEDILAMFEQNP